jgi:hypothetical protein
VLLILAALHLTCLAVVFLLVAVAPQGGPQDD